jgi:hypothetical protein
MIKDEGKVAPVHVVKGYIWSTGIDPQFFTSGINGDGYST